ncbi:STAS domain-containing protein [Sphingomonas azotifigens]|uniref:STAS domain-containing protein n=1 Tax=Sphingomonas azotifigens TaxID=330920 RepID=UPI0009FD95CD|nr:STAS domain-containing protein [Sphingomonas azotifigens]
MDLHIGASAALPNAAELRQKCIDVLEESGPITVDISTVTEADLSFLQLLHALRDAGRQAGREVRLRSPAPPPVVALLERAGFLAAPSADDLDFWFHGERAQ